jgi:transcription elongation factor GreA
MVVQEDVVRIGSSVQVKDGPDLDWYTLVGPEDADAMAGRISTDSPLGTALLGHRAGERVQVRRPGGRGVVVIAAVAAGRS